MSIEVLLLIVGILIVLALGAYAWRLTRQVQVMEAKQLEEEQLAAQNLRNKQMETIEDIRFLCRSVMAEQCEITEGVMRLHFAVNSLDTSYWFRDELKSLRSHHDSTSAMPILDAYKKLPAKQRFELDKTRWKLEEDNKAAIMKELDWLLNSSFQEIFRIH